jgi:flagellar basal-body rod protein FlgB
MILKDHLFRNKLPLMNRALDAYSMRQRVTASNIANATTPEYRPERVRFEEDFREAQVTIPGVRDSDAHIPIGPRRDSEIKPHTTDAQVPRPEILFSGESHVNVDKEMNELAQNQIKFRFASRMTQRYFSGMQSAIRGSAQ